MNLMQLLALLRARKLIFLGTLATIFGLTLALSLLLPKSYVATVSVVLDSKGTDPITGMVLPGQFLQGYMATQIDIITSHNVALKVVDQLKLADLPALREKFHQENGGAGSLRDWIADKLLRDLDVKPSRESSVIDLLYEGRDPQYAAELANAFAQAYVQVGLELAADPARRQSKWFGQQVDALRANLEAAQARLAAFQHESTFVTGEERSDVENARLAEISEQLVAAQANTYDALGKVKQMNAIDARGRLQELPDILGNPLLQNLKADLVRAEGKFAQVSQRYDRNHPEYISAAAELSTLRSKFNSELHVARGSINQSAQLAQQRERELQAALERQKARILALKEERDRYDVLNRGVENAQKAYDSAVQRAEQVRLESKLDQSGVSILNPAIAPLHPAKPRVLLNSILSVFVGCVLGVGLALIAELRDRRLRTRADLAAGIGVPVLAELPLFATGKALAAPQGLLIEQQ